MFITSSLQAFRSSFLPRYRSILLCMWILSLMAFIAPSNSSAQTLLLATNYSCVVGSDYESPANGSESFPLFVNTYQSPVQFATQATGPYGTGPYSQCSYSGFAPKGTLAKAGATLSYTTAFSGYTNPSSYGKVTVLGQTWMQKLPGINYGKVHTLPIPVGTDLSTITLTAQAFAGANDPDVYDELDVWSISVSN